MDTARTALTPMVITAMATMDMATAVMAWAMVPIKGLGVAAMAATSRTAMATSSIHIGHQCLPAP